MNKDILLIVCILVAVGSIAAAVFTFERQGKLTKSLEEEKYGRLVAEESSQKSAAKLATLQNQVKTAEEKMTKMKDVLDQEKGVNEDLKAQYQRLAETKAELEAKLSSTLEAEKTEAAPAAEEEVQPAPAAEAQ
jgi:hypothetical protein